jgi:hypothetical protein
VTLEEVARYTKAPEQKKLARSAMARLAGEEERKAKFPNLLRRFGKNAKKAMEIKVDLAAWRPVGGPTKHAESTC